MTPGAETAKAKEGEHAPSVRLEAERGVTRAGCAREGTVQGWVSKSTGRGRAHYLVESRPACEGMSFRGRDWIAKFTCGFVERSPHDHLCPWCVELCRDAGIPVPQCECGRCTAERASVAARERRLRETAA
jgi:hypothetical protein